MRIVFYDQAAVHLASGFVAGVLFIYKLDSTMDQA